MSTKNSITLKIDKDITPVHNLARRIPFSLKERVKKEFDKNGATWSNQEARRLHRLGKSYGRCRKAKQITENMPRSTRSE